MSWNVSGTYFEACNCDVACPCVFLGAPTTGECTALVGWHVEHGTHEGLDLAGLNVALAVHSPGTMTEVPWRVALYLDDTAAEDQAAGLLAIFSGSAGGHPAMLAAHVGEVIGVANAPITVQTEDAKTQGTETQGARMSIRIGEVAEVRMTQLVGQGGNPITISNHPLCIAPGYDAVVSRSDQLRYNDHGFAWELSGKNAFSSPFSYEG